MSINRTHKSSRIKFFRRIPLAVLIAVSITLLFSACVNIKSDGKDSLAKNDNTIYATESNSDINTETDTVTDIATDTEKPADTDTDTTNAVDTEDFETTGIPMTETDTQETSTPDTETEAVDTDNAESTEAINTETAHKKYSDAFALIGKSESDIVTDEFEENTEFVYEYKNLPKGQIFAVEFSEKFLPSERTSEKTIKFKVSKGSNPEKVKTEEGDTRVYLTFDDGPNPKNTERILNTLAEYGIKATFFSVGSYVELYPEIVKRVSDEGHTIACHSYSHNYSELYADAESFTAEIAAWEDAVSDALGFIPAERIFRFPGGSTNCKTPGMKTVLAELGYRGFDWNALNNDCYVKRRPQGMTEDEYLKETFRTTVDNSLKMKNNPHIVLMHETYSQTADMLSYAIDYLIEKGCTFATLDELGSCWYY